MSNPNINPSLLDAGQIVKRVYDADNDAIRIELGTATGMSVSLDHSDSVVVLGTEDGTAGGTYHALKVDSNGIQYVRGDSISGNTGTLNSTSSGVVLSPISCSGIKSFQLYSNITAVADAMMGTGGAITARIDISPQSSGTAFYSTSTTLTIAGGGSVGDVGISSLLSDIVGMRVRISLTANGLSVGDTVVFYLVGSSF